MHAPHCLLVYLFIFRMILFCLIVKISVAFMWVFLWQCFASYPILFLSPPVECTPEVDLCLIIDVSQNSPAQIPGDFLDNIRQALEILATLTTEYIDLNLDETRVGVVYFGERAQLQYSLASPKEPSLLRDALRRLISTNFGQGPSNPGEGLRIAREQCFGGAGDRDDARNVALMATSGMGLSEPARNVALSEARALRHSGVFLAVFGIKDVSSAEVQFLQDLSSPPKEVGLTQSYDLQIQSINRIWDSIVRASCDLPSG